MKETCMKLNRQLNALSVFRSILETPVVSNLQKLLYAIEEGSIDERLLRYGAFSKALYAEGGNFTVFVKEFVEKDENIYLTSKLYDQSISPSIEECVQAELALLSQLAQVSSAQLKPLMEYDGFLPGWETADLDLVSAYEAMIESLPVRGHGIFAKHRAFRVKDGKLVPVKNADGQSINQLYGYQRERNQVLENTRALAEGKPASNVLLYGDAGTGKSSTIKACANACFDQGVRLVEFDKTQLEDIPSIMEQLYNYPLKFIFYIDDLTFNQNDDAFSALKGILEGNVISSSKNIAIYATSNRRHLIKESMEARMGNDLHLNDTLQETMSLSARFGLTITFSKPEKDLYLEIVKNLAEEYGLQVEEAELFRKAEAFAIRSNGRSPRTAKQFIQLVSIGIK
ncbi:MAG: ATP-binding protein [Firmicutes bacterium]|nr:ATP-binding protein [Bacillota bacterium]